MNPFYVHITGKTTFLFPIGDKTSQRNDIINPVMDSIMSGKSDVSSLVEMNKKVKALF